MRRFLSSCLLLASAPAFAQGPVGPSVIRVVGHGLVKNPPDVATLTFQVRGEGATSDEAVRALVGKREAIDAALAGKAQVRTGKLSIKAARDKACSDDENSDAVRLSSGACAIRGYIATLGVTAKVKPVAEAGTLLGLVGRLGATDPTLEDFDLSDPVAAGRAAIADAIRDAQQQASAIAAASHVALGRLRRVEDQRNAEPTLQDVVVSGQRRAPAPATMAPIPIVLTPEPIETSETLVVEFEIGGSAP